MPMLHLVHSFICQWTAVLLHLLATVNNATMNMDVQVFVLVPAFNFLGYIPRSRIA